MHSEKEAPKLNFRKDIKGIGGNIHVFDDYEKNLNREKAIKKHTSNSVFNGVNGSIMNI